jgi:hypothetical protein
LRLVDRSDLAAFFAGFFPSIGRSISFWPAEAFRGGFDGKGKSSRAKRDT